VADGLTKKRRGSVSKRGQPRSEGKATSRSAGKTSSRRRGAKRGANSARGSGRPLVRAFVDRVGGYLQSFAERTPDSVLALALREQSAVGTIARALNEQIPTEESLGHHDHAIAAALARGAQLKEQLLKQAGGIYTARQIGELLGITTRQGVAVRRERKRLLGLPTRSSSGGVAYVYPKAQITDSGLLPGLHEFLSAFTLPDPWTQLAVLISPSSRLEGRSPLQALQSGRTEDAIAVAAAYGEQGA
jgi:hypothetical protein